MILIQGEESDSSIFTVIEYLNRYGSDFKKINENDFAQLKCLEFSNDSANVILEYGSHQIDVNAIDVYWYRRGEVRMTAEYFESDLGTVPAIGLNNYLLSEYKILLKAINRVLENIPIKIGAFTKSQLDKFDQMSAAKNSGLEVPSSYIFTQKKELVQLIERSGRVATKGVHKTFSEEGHDGRRYFMYTSIVSEADLKTIPDKFFPTLFQNYVEKKYELRIFFVHDQYFPMAIFSQSNPKTKTDFRNYDFGEPNRTVPVLLPEEIMYKLKATMALLTIDTGSIDMIVTPDNRYVFLEVNPDGQFGMVSHPCNYFIEREIAKILSKYDTNKHE